MPMIACPTIFKYVSCVWRRAAFHLFGMRQGLHSFSFLLTLDFVCGCVCGGWGDRYSFYCSTWSNLCKTLFLYTPCTVYFMLELGQIVAACITPYSVKTSYQTCSVHGAKLKTSSISLLLCKVHCPSTNYDKKRFKDTVSQLLTCCCTVNEA